MPLLVKTQLPPFTFWGAAVLYAFPDCRGSEWSNTIPLYLRRVVSLATITLQTARICDLTQNSKRLPNILGSANCKLTERFARNNDVNAILTGGVER